MTRHQSPTTRQQDEINFLDYWKVIKRYRVMIAGIVAVVSVFAVISSLLMTKMYKAEALIVPVASKGSGLASLAGDLGGLAKLAGANIPGGAGESEKIMAILKSRTLAENVIQREHLMPILFEKKWDSKAGKWKSNDPKKQPNMEDAVRKVKGSTVVQYDKKEKTISIEGKAPSPVLAARLVNAYVDELQKFISANAFTTAKRNRLFIEAQLEENKLDLLEAGKSINEYYHAGHISSIEAMVDVPITRKPGAHGTGTQMQRPEDAPSPKNDSPVVANDSDPLNSGAAALHSDIGEAMAQKAELEKKIADAKVVQDVPQQVYLSYLMLRRELLGKVNALLTTQYELAKIEESKEDLAFQVIDWAVPPVMRFSPKRAQICIMAFMSALLAAIFIAFFREHLKKMKAAETMRRNP